MPQETVEVKGHIIDSLTLPKILDVILGANGATYNLDELRIGEKRTDTSYARIKIRASNEGVLKRLLAEIKRLGARRVVHMTMKGTVTGTRMRALERKRAQQVAELSRVKLDSDGKAYRDHVRRVESNTLLMASPEYFTVAYEINPWMRISRQPNSARSVRQWKTLYRTLKEKAGANILLIPPVPGYPDLVFTANAGLVAGKRFILSRFRHAERRREEPYFKQWFTKHGYRVRTLPPRCYFEGEGDLLYVGSKLFMGYRFRSEMKAHHVLSTWLTEQVLPLELVDKRFYHLDTCFLPLNERTALYYPGAFDSYARKVIKHHIQNPIPVTLKEAKKFVLNGVVIGKTLVTNVGMSGKTKRAVRREGVKIEEVDLSEFHKSGGSAKCLTLFLPARWSRKSA